MKKWNGKDKWSNYQYDINEIEKWRMTIDDNGTVYYKTPDQSEESSPMVWCTASRLTDHLHKILIVLPARTN